VGLRKILLIIFVVMSGALWVQAAPPQQTGRELHYGETASGEITPMTTCEYFWFDGTANNRITVDMRRTSGDLDGVLYLYLRDGHNFTSKPLVSNDDRGDGSLDPQISMLLPANDWYSVAACRPEARVTSGTYDLTLVGPGDTVPTARPTLPQAAPTELLATPSGPTVTPSPTSAGLSGLTMGVIHSGTETPTPTSDSVTTDVLTNGSSVSGILSSGGIDYSLVAQAGEWIELVWTGDTAPQISVLDSRHVLLALASSVAPTPNLVLGFIAPQSDTFTVHIDCFDCIGAPFVLMVTLSRDSESSLGMPTPVAVVTQPVVVSTATPPPAVEPSPTPAPDYLANPCQSSADAVISPASSEHVSNAYTASGDGYRPAEATTTDVFVGDDDLNVVFTVLGSTSRTASAVFCSPSGRAYDALESDVQKNQDYLFGLDWESGNGSQWETGTWTAEIYINDLLELTLQFEVQ
jgi:hypothetical protein